MSPKTKTLMVCAIALMAVYKAGNQVTDYVGGLTVVRGDIPAPATTNLNSAAFYPILVEQLNKERPSAVLANDLGSAFYKAPILPDPEEEMERNPIHPINFLAREQANFRLNAVLPQQGMAIINGRSVSIGEALPGHVTTQYRQHDGSVAKEVIVPRLAEINGTSVRLTAEHSQGWPQEIQVSMPM